VFVAELFELRDEFRVATCSEILLDPVLEDGEPLILQAPAGIVREALVSQVQERGSPPERECLLAPPFLRELLESLQIELTLVEPEEIARISRQQPAVPELLAEMRDRVLKDLRGGRRGPLIPERASMSRTLGTTSLAWSRLSRAGRRMRCPSRAPRLRG
jgi:hypothetical protein